MTADIVRYLTHPQVQIDPAVPVPQWGLSSVGRARAEALANAGWLASTTQIVSSAERKGDRDRGDHRRPPRTHDRDPRGHA
ncbi:hypothetical protein ACVWXN_000709 [Bradyrhizobium sp. i1.4.4]